ncbi:MULTISPECIES: hypothetical protein [unclassified Arenibacter]|uniref:hypothetical protein n=1 Tax=unclassified Arenibacter TaxID=2615047 RepID=UPI0011C0F15D|nr:MULTISPECIES: hypothetical protein [unclassified Arenibacter]
MKTLFFSCMALFIQFTDQKIEKFLGVNINELSTELLHNTLKEGSIYWILNKSKEEFYGHEYNRIIFTTDNKDVIESIDLIFPGIVLDLQKKLEEGHYGKANKNFIIDKVEEGEEIETDFAFLKESYIALKEDGPNTDTTPFLVYWYKEKFFIKLLFDYDNNKTSILFSVNKEPTP